MQEDSISEKKEFPMDHVTVWATELHGTALLWAFSRALGRDDPVYRYDDGSFGYIGRPDRQGRLQPNLEEIVEQQRMHICPIELNDQPAFEAWVDGMTRQKTSAMSQRAVDAAMRSLVRHRFGDELAIPREVYEHDQKRAGGLAAQEAAAPAARPAQERG